METISDNNTLLNNTNTDNNYWTPDVITLGPGGAKGFLELGLLLAFEQENYYVDTTIWQGCSVGSVISLLIVCGYTVTEIINDCISINIINDITDINLDHIKEKPGLLNIKSVENLIKKRIIEKFGIVPTLKQLYMFTGILLELVTFNVDKSRPEYLSKNTEPNLSCVDAVIMSMSIPGLICPKIYRGNAYVDGAIGDPYPVLEYDNENRKILGIYIESETSNHSSDKNPLRFFYRCAQGSMTRLRERSIKQASDNCKHIALKTPIHDTTGLSLNINNKKSMIEHGYKTGMIFINRIKYPDKYNLILNDDEEIAYDTDNNNDVLDNDSINIINMLSNNENESVVFNDVNEDLFIESDSSETLYIPIENN